LTVCPTALLFCTWQYAHSLAVLYLTVCPTALLFCTWQYAPQPCCFVLDSTLHSLAVLYLKRQTNLTVKFSDFSTVLCIFREIMPGCLKGDDSGSLFYLTNIVFTSRRYFAMRMGWRLSELRYYDKRADRKWQPIVVK
jgi:hypothetical protein